MSILYSKILTSILFPMADMVMNTSISQFNKEIASMNSWTKEQIDKWRSEQISKLVGHAYLNTTYYKNLFDKEGIDPNEINSIESLAKVPPLTKKIISDNFGDFIPQNLSDINYIKKNTGGSTGDPFSYYLDKRSWSYVVASNMYYWRKIGHRPGQKFIALGSHSILPDKSKKSLKHEIYYWLKGKKPINAMNMSQEHSIQHLGNIKKKRFKYIYGYASSIFLLAKTAIEHNIEMPYIKGCITTSEILTDYYSETIKKAFDCDILDAYGASDGGVNAYKLNDGKYRVGYNCIVRIDSESEGKEGGGILQVTDVYNYAMPLINYQLGDSAIIVQDTSTYNGQLFNKVFGRESDFIKLDNGNILTGPGFTIFFKDMNVEAYSIRQTGGLEILVEIKKNKDYKNEFDDLIISTMKKYAGKDCSIKLNHVNEFELTNSGKRRYFYSD